MDSTTNGVVPGMAGDWLKVRTNLYRDHKLLAMARRLREDPQFMGWLAGPQPVTKCDVVTFDIVTRVTLASLVVTWSFVNESISDGSDTVHGIDLTCIDAMAGVPGFGAAMAAVGWAVEMSDGVEFPNFREFNAPPKERAGGRRAMSGAERTKKWRDRQRGVQENVTRDVTVTAEEEEEEDLPDPDPDPESGKPPDALDGEEPELDPTSAFASLSMSVAQDTAKFHEWHMRICQRKNPPPGMKPTEQSFLRTLAVWEWAVENARRNGNRPLQFFARKMGNKRKPWVGWSNKHKTDAEVRLRRFNEQRNCNTPAG